MVFVIRWWICFKILSWPNKHLFWTSICWAEWSEFFIYFFLYGFVPLWLVEFVSSNVFVLNLWACQYFSFVGPGCFSAALILSPLLLTVLTADFGLYLKDVKFLKLCCCKSFFGCSFIGCYNVHYFLVILFSAAALRLFWFY